MAKQVKAVYDHWPALSQRDFDRLMSEFEAFCEEGSMIVNKNGQAVPFELNEAQSLTARWILKEVFKPFPSPINVFIHKSRQMGISVVIAKIEQFLCTKLPNINCQHIMPVEADADDLCDKKFIPLLEGTHPLLLPNVTAIKRRVKFLDMDGKPIKSSVDFTSAENRSGSRGQTNQIVIQDEYAHYGNPEYLNRGVIATMPRTGRSIRVVVSTAYGMNHFYDLSKAAQQSEHWKYYFLPWHMLKEYEREPKGRLKELASLTPYEVKLCEIFEQYKYPVESWPRKMAWYEYTLETEAKMDQDHMFENYPSTADESFAATGAPVLPANKIREFREAEKPYEYVEMIQDSAGKTSIIKTNLSTMKRFAEPIRGRKYIIGVDPADGGEQGDFSAAAVIDLTTMEDVFCIKEKIDQNDFAELLSNLGRYYNNAQIVPERNTGQSLIDWLVMLKYPNIYINPIHTTKVKVSYGIYMTPMVKKDAITRLKFLINSGTYKSYDPDFIDEALHFVWKKTPSGMQKAIGGEGHGDDVVMSRIIAVAALNMNRYKGYGKEAQQI